VKKISSAAARCASVAVWQMSFFKRRIEWRGSEYYIRNKRLIPAE